MSKKRLKIVFITDSYNAANPKTYYIVIGNIATPPFALDSVRNNIKFTVFLASADESAITHIGINY